MQEYRCDGCGRKLAKRDLRYTVSIDVKAAYDEVEIHLHDLVRDHRSELEALLQRLNEKATTDLEASVYKKLELDLCPSCQRAYIREPLRFHPERSDPHAETTNVDEFLRSLGYGGPRTPDEED